MPGGQGEPEGMLTGWLSGGHREAAVQSQEPHTTQGSTRGSSSTGMFCLKKVTAGRRGPAAPGRPAERLPIALAWDGSAWPSACALRSLSGSVFSHCKKSSFSKKKKSRKRNRHSAPAPLVLCKV